MTGSSGDSQVRSGSRPILWTSGTGCDADRGANLGQAGYSYAFVARQFARMLEADFDLRPVADCVSSGSSSPGTIAGHLSFRPPQDVELLPGVKNVIVPAWEFPEIPRAPWMADPRDDWARTANACDLILQLCEFTRDAFVRGGVTTPMAVVPVPVSPDYFGVADWQADQVVTLKTPAIVLSGKAISPPAATASSGSGSPNRIGVGWGIASARSVYQRCVRPWVPWWIERGLKAGLREARRQRRLSQGARALRADSVTLSGVVFTSLFNPLDRRKNWEDLISAWILTLGQKSNATLVLKLVGNDPSGLDEVLFWLQSLDLGPGGRVVVLTGFLSEEQMIDLARATTWYVTPTRAEGACLPLMQWLAAGRPAVATCHTAIQDYFSPAQGLVVESHPEPCPWPHDPSQVLRTHWQRIVWSSLAQQLERAYRMVVEDPVRYRDMSHEARRVSRERHHPDVVGPRLRKALWDVVGQPSI